MKKQKKPNRRQTPPLFRGAETKEVDHRDPAGVPQYTDRAVRESREWVQENEL